MEYEVLEDCLCERYLQELASHWREGLERKELKKGQVLTKVGETRNLIGFFIKLKDKDGKTYEIPPRKLKLNPLLK